VRPGSGRRTWNFGVARGNDCIRPHLDLEGRAIVGVHDVADGQNEDLHASSKTSGEIDHGEPGGRLSALPHNLGLGTQTLGERALS
jgi:hypothetical protein